MHSQQDETKKFMDFELDILDNSEFYLNEIIANITDNKFDLNFIILTICMSILSLFHFLLIKYILKIPG